MNREEVLYLLPYFFSLVLSFGVFIYTWKHRYVRGAKVYSLFVAGQTITILAFIFELISPNLETKILWDKFQWLSDSFLIIVPFLIFSVQFSEHPMRKITWGIWLLMPILFTLILLTDNIHHLIYPNPHLSTDQPFPDLQYDFTYIIYAYSLLFIYGANFTGIGFLVRRALQPLNKFRLQYWVIVIGFLIPILMSFFTILDIRLITQRDLSPFSFAIGNLVVAWGLFRYGLFDIVPIAREHIVENISDPIVVLDINNRIVDINPAALTLFDKKLSEAIKRPSSDVFAKWPVIVDALKSDKLERKEITISDEDDTFYFDLNISFIYNRSGNLLGRIISARDVTRHKTLEAGYRTLSSELEQQVNERTEELRKAADRYKAVVEHQTEFIVRWTPDGKRTFANEAYCQYFGLTQEQALSTSFLPFVAEEDRQAIKDKIARLTSGTVKYETETHRVIRPDGSIGWQEWTDQAILDDKGNVIELQSIGRDVTQRKQNEQLILKELEFDTLITKLLTSFATSAYNEVNASIESALEKIAIFFGVDFADILLLSENKSTWTSTHSWISPKINKSVHPIANIKTGALKWSEEKLINGESIRINTLDDYPPEAMPDCKFGEQEGIKSLISVPIKGREGSIFGVLDIVSYNLQIDWSDSDVTHLRIIGDAIANTLERLRAEEAMQKSEMKHRLLFEAANDAIVIMQADRFVDCNSKALEMFGCKKEELIGSTPVDFSTPTQPDGKSSQEKALEKIGAASQGAPQFFEWRHRRLDGTPFDAEVSLNLLKLDDNTLVQGIVRDITERKQAEEKLAEAYETTLEGWAKALELRDKETEGHSRRVTEATVTVARAMGIPEEEIEHIHRGSILHDIGKMGIPDDILRKNGPLTDDEREIVKKHPTTAYDLLKPIPYLKQALEIPYSHHEKWDGSGYPQGLKGEDIPLSARIFAVVDVWDALSSDRPYRKAWSKEQVALYLLDESGKHFDPRVVNKFLHLVEKGEI